MKKVIFALFVMLLIAGCAPEKQDVKWLAGAPFGQTDLELLYDTANEGTYTNLADAVTFLATTGDYANIPSTNILTIPDGTTVVTLYFCGTSTNNDTFNALIFGYLPGNGPAEIVCSVAGVIGTNAVVLYPDDGATATNAYWADTLTVTDNWKTGGGCYTQTNGSNYINTLSFDPLQLKYLSAIVYGTKGAETAGECDNVTIFAAFLREGNK